MFWPSMTVEWLSFHWLNGIYFSKCMDINKRGYLFHLEPSINEDVYDLFTGPGGYQYGPTDFHIAFA
jgi:hypothetical protein